MKRYRVILSEDAAWDMQEIHNYIRYELFSPKNIILAVHSMISVSFFP